MLKIILRHLNITIIALITLVILNVLVFLYLFSYRTITQTDEIIVLRNQVSPVRFDERLWSDVVDGVKQKKEPKEVPGDISDPFQL